MAEPTSTNAPRRRKRETKAHEVTPPNVMTRQSTKPIPKAGQVGVPTAQSAWHGTSKRKYTRRDLMGEERAYMLAKMRDCALAGMTDYEIAAEFNINPVQLHRWSQEDPETFRALRAPIAILNQRVKSALYHKAVGYTHMTEEIRVVKEPRLTGDGKRYMEDVIQRLPVVKHVAPDLGAAIFWLTNMDRENWKNSQRHEHTGNVKVEETEGDPRKLALALFDIMRAAAEDAGKTPAEGPVIEDMGEDE